ncbi:DUF4912 domain-containing protein [Oscillatoria sp. CS-180]|uniref:DUF4912 domain-containing protein n=1 Tax=Oscillatoria sp. CS-180 TaxID=3021720 RepID=UPI00232A89B3|nr:DUF4912 domain-containing protein [Oscillatoria sp. CS-180]MDB9528746.1 DUF4912 domain-containing protein [Oscillatoria sp. CS-180]
MSPSNLSLDEMTLRQLRRVASEFEVSRYSRMRKTELIDAIEAARARRTSSAPTPSVTVEGQTEVEASKFVPSTEPIPPEVLASVDEGLPDLPSGYGESRIVLMPRDPQWAYAYWDIPNEHKEELRRQGGGRLALRFYDVTDINMGYQAPHSLQQYECDEMAREWYIPIPVSDRDYAIEIGYLCNDGRWLLLARSTPVHIPPVYPSDWIEDHFMTVGWDQDLRGKSIMTLTHPSKRVSADADNAIYKEIFGMAESAEAQRVAGSLFGSMQHVAGSLMSSFAVPVSSYVFPSGVGMWAGGAAPGAELLTMSGLNMSGVGFSASAPPVRPRQFWLVADAELIVYGATEPDATVTIGGKPIKLNSDGTFRFQMSFQDGLIDYPIFAVAADGEQNRAVHMKFTRETPHRRTNTKEEAVQEWLS